MTNGGTTKDQARSGLMAPTTATPAAITSARVAVSVTSSDFRCLLRKRYTMVNPHGTMPASMFFLSVSEIIHEVVHRAEEIYLSS